MRPLPFPTRESLGIEVERQMKPTDRMDRVLVEALLAGGYLPSYELSLKLGRDIQDAWMDSYQEVQITNTFKVVLKRKLAEF
jgi:hypothetical protein